MNNYDFNSHSMNGQAVPYCALPFHALDTVFRHNELTPTAKSAYVRLLSYAAYKNKLTFNITATWLSEALSVTYKTAHAALKQLKDFGFAHDNGIVVPASDKFCSNKTKTAQTTQHSQNAGNAFCSNKTQSQNQQANFVQTKSCEKVENTQETASSSSEQEKQDQNSVSVDQNELEAMVQTLIATGFSKEKAERIAKARLEKASNEANKDQADVVKNTSEICKNYTDNNIPKVTTQENLPIKSVNFAVANNAEQYAKQQNGRFTSFSGKGKLENAGNKLKDMLKSALNQMGRIRNPESYIQKSLLRMGVKGQEELSRYASEILHSVKNGQMQSIDGCLWLIEQGRWKAPAGMY